VTPQHAWEILADTDCREVAVLGVTRAISTRHGVGPFPTWSREMTAQFIDKGNPTNPWQGAIRCGPLDLVLLDYAARVSRVDGLAVTCLDQLPAKPQVCTAYQGIERLDIPGSLKDQAALTERLEAAVPILRDTTIEGLLESLNEIAPVRYTASGPQAGNWTHGNPAVEQVLNFA
jgi:adenylosuccinate synthase